MTKRLIIDTHAHLTDPSLHEKLGEFLQQASDADVRGVLCVGIELESSRLAVEIAQQHPGVQAAVGIHPNSCCQAGADDWEAIKQLCTHPEVVALGETGLDRYWDDCPWDIQLAYFRRHLQLSRETDLPVVIHTRDCAKETLEMLQHEADGGQLRGLMHSFTGPQSVADGCLELGLYISFAGMATFKNAAEIRDIAKTIPDDRILVETDSPYLTPHPLRGKRPNHPALVVHTLTALAEARGQSVDQLAELTSCNAQRLFGCWQTA